MIRFSRQVSERFALAGCSVSSPQSKQTNKHFLYRNCVLDLRLRSYFRKSVCHFSTSCFLRELDSPHTSEVAKDTVARLKTYGISEDNILSHPELSKLPLSMIQLRLQFCVEGGLRPNIMCLTKFDDIVQSSPTVLRSAGLLPEKTDVVQRMLNSVNFDGPTPTHIDRNAPYETVHFQALCHCMEYFYGFSYPSWKRYLHASLQFTFDNVKSLMDANLGWRWIRDHPSMICFANPHNVVRLCELEKFYEVPIALSQLLRRDADIAFVNFEDLRSVFFLLMKHEICKHDVVTVKKGEHFLIHPDILDKHFQELKKSAPSQSENHLSLLYKQKLIIPEKKRTEGYLERMITRQNHPCQPIDDKSAALEGSWQHELKLWLEAKKNRLQHKPCRHAPFLSNPPLEESEEPRNFMENTVNSRMKMLNIKKPARLVTCLASELNVHENFIKTELARIPLGLTVDVQKAYDTFKFLRDYGFTVGEIKESVQILLYPRQIVKDTLHQLVDSDPVYGSQAHRDRHLQLCLYLILMKYSYSLPHS